MTPQMVSPQCRETKWSKVSLTKEQHDCYVSTWNYRSSIVRGVNPLSANGDQHQFSPNNIHNLSRDKVMRMNEMIT